MMRFLNKPIPDPSNTEGSELAVLWTSKDGKRHISILRKAGATMPYLTNQSEDSPLFGIVPKLPDRWVDENGRVFPDGYESSLAKVGGWLWLNRT